MAAAAEREVIGLRREGAFRVGLGAVDVEAVGLGVATRVAVGGTEEHITSASAGSQPPETCTGALVRRGTMCVGAV